MATKKQTAGPHRVGDKHPSATDEARQRRKAQGKAKRETVASVHAEYERLRAALTVHQQRIAGEIARLHGADADVRVHLADLDRRLSTCGDETRSVRLAVMLWRRLRWLVLGR